MPQRSLHLLIIDPQNDFCDLPQAYWPVDPVTGAAKGPALPVSGAHADMLRLAQTLVAQGRGLTDVTVTLDSHHRLDIGHPAFWLSASGEQVPPFTQISAADVKSGRFLPRPAGALPRVLAYLEALEACGRYTHMVWPQHCEIGTWGHNIHANLSHALSCWEQMQGRASYTIFKGTNPWTEHYSAVKAEVPDPEDPSTQESRDLFRRLEGAERIFIAGEASSHCVKATCEHIFDAFPVESLHRFMLLEDCMSPVGGFEQHASAFLAEMKARGVQVCGSAEMAAELKANA